MRDSSMLSQPRTFLALHAHFGPRCRDFKCMLMSVALRRPYKVASPVLFHLYHSRQLGPTPNQASTSDVIQDHRLTGLTLPTGHNTIHVRRRVEEQVDISFRKTRETQTEDSCMLLPGLRQERTKYFAAASATSSRATVSHPHPPTH